MNAVRRTVTPMRRLLYPLLPLLVATALQAAPPVVRIEGDRLTVRAEQAPLRDILEQFAHADVTVKLDPAIDVLITGSCRRTPMEEGLDALLEPFSYVLFWETVPGPLGTLPRLTEIQVFGQGGREAARPMLPDDGHFVVTRAPSGGPPFVADEILLTVRAGVTLDAFRNLLAQIGGTVVGSVPDLGVYRVRLPAGTNVPDLLAQLARNDLLQEAQPNYVHQLPAPAAGEPAETGPARAAPAPADGTPRLAILDSGLRTGSEADGSVVSRLDALDPKRTLGDTAGHGTQMALVAAGSVQPRGAPDSDEGVPLIAVRAFDDRGLTTDFSLMRGITHALKEGARVINLSWGSETDSGFVANAVAFAQFQGAVVVAAAGNEPTGRKLYPAAYEGVVAVAALDGQGQPWKNSNHGDFVDVAAPGSATMPLGYQGPPGSYAGTSIASAYVAREIALYLNRHPKAKAREAITAVQAALSASFQGYGQGTLDAAAVLRLRKN